MAAKYDQGILQQYSDRLYKRASRIVAWDTVIGLVVGLILAMILATLEAATSQRQPIHSSAPLLLAIAGLIIGYVIGNGRAFSLRLEAQRTLLQMEIERNTRPVSSVLDDTNDRAPVTPPQSPPREGTLSPRPDMTAGAATPSGEAESASLPHRPSSKSKPGDVFGLS